MLYLPYAALLAAMASAASIPEHQLNNHLKVDFSVLRGNSRSTAQKGAREGLVARNFYDLELTNQLSYYSSTIKVGSNGDESSVLVDTGSADLWIMSADVGCYALPNSKRSLDDIPLSHGPVFELENKKPNFEKRDGYANSLTVAATSTSSTGPARIDASSCTASGSFKTEASNSFHLNSTAPAFEIEYADGTFAKGVWGSDYVSIGSLNVSQCNFAIVNETTSDIGVFGIGLPDLEVTSFYASVADEYTYENFPMRLKSSGVINKVAYSLYLNDVDSLTGSVLFGAVDHAKYTGQLKTVPIMNLYKKWYDHPVTFEIVLDSISLEDPSQQVAVWDTPFTALLDSGSTLSHLPKDVIKSLASLLDGKLTQEGYYEVDCIYNTTTADAVFNFSGAHIRVPISDLIMSAEMAGDSKCYLGLRPHKDGSSTLGDNFLRHAYVVYDLENYEISLAQVKYSDSQNIEVISNTIPLAVKAPGYSSTSFAQVLSSHPTASRLTFATTTSHWTGINTSTTTVTPSNGVPTVVVEVPFALTSTSTAAVSHTSTEVVTGTDGLETLVVIVPEASSSVASSSAIGSSSAGVSSTGVSYSGVSYSGVSSAIASSSVVTTSVAASSSGVSSSGVSSTSVIPSGVISSSSVSSSAVSSSAVSSSVIPSVIPSVVSSSFAWNESYVTTPGSRSSVASSSSSGFSNLTIETVTSVSATTNEAGSTVFVAYTLTVTHCPDGCSLVATKTLSSDISLTTETLTSVSATTNAEGSTMFVTNTFSTTYCPNSFATVATESVSTLSSSFTTETLTSVSTSTDAEGSAVFVTNTYTTTYCPESTPVSASRTTYVTVVQTIGKPLATQASVSGQIVATKSGVSSQTLAYKESSTTAVLSASSYISGNSIIGSSYISGNSTIGSSYISTNRTIGSSSLYPPQTSSITILQGGSSALSIILTMLLMPLFALL